MKTTLTILNESGTPIRLHYDLDKMPAIRDFLTPLTGITSVYAASWPEDKGFNFYKLWTNRK